MPPRAWKRFLTAVAVTVSFGVAASAGTALASPAPDTAASIAAGFHDPAGLPADYQAFLASVGGSHYADVNGVPIHFVEAGPRNAPTLLLLHGSPDNIYAWRNIMPGLARHYHVVAPDLVGFGLSGIPAGPLTWSTEISYLSAFVRDEHLTRLTLVATDIGGLFGFGYAAAHPANVAAIALWETVTAPIPSYALLGSYCAACVSFFQVPKDPVLAAKDIIDNPGFAQQIYGGSGLVHPLSGSALAGYRYFLRTTAQRRVVAEIGADMPIGGTPCHQLPHRGQLRPVPAHQPRPQTGPVREPGKHPPGSHRHRPRDAQHHGRLRRRRLPLPRRRRARRHHQSHPAMAQRAASLSRELWCSVISSFRPVCSLGDLVGGDLAQGGVEAGRVRIAVIPGPPAHRTWCRGCCGGPHSAGGTGPNSVTEGRANAVARWDIPVSPDTTSRADATRAASSASDVRPASTHPSGSPASSATRDANPRSAAEPVTRTAWPAAASCRATAANRSAASAGRPPPPPDGPG